MLPLQRRFWIKARVPKTWWPLGNGSSFGNLGLTRFAFTVLRRRTKPVFCQSRWKGAGTGSRLVQKFLAKAPNVLSWLSTSYQYHRHQMSCYGGKISPAFNNTVWYTFLNAFGRRYGLRNHSTPFSATKSWFSLCTFQACWVYLGLHNASRIYSLRLPKGVQMEAMASNCFFNWQKIVNLALSFFLLVGAERKIPRFARQPIFSFPVLVKKERKPSLFQTMCVGACSQ